MQDELAALWNYIEQGDQRGIKIMFSLLWAKRFLKSVLYTQVLVLTSFVRDCSLMIFCVAFLNVLLSICIVFYLLYFNLQPKIANMLMEKLPEFTEEDNKYVTFGFSYKLCM